MAAAVVDPLEIRVVRLHADATVPAYMSAGAAGLDLCAYLADRTGPSWQLLPNGGTQLVPTGLAMAIPPAYEAQVRPRSGLAFKHGVTVLNSPGTIDSDYRGEIKILLINHGNAVFVIEHGMRIAQLVIAPVARAQLTVVATLDDTARGAGGYGSTGR